MSAVDEIKDGVREGGVEQLIGNIADRIAFSADRDAEAMNRSLNNKHTEAGHQLAALLRREARGLALLVAPAK